MLNQGLTDSPVEKSSHDLFGIQAYVKGLRSFIVECETPMTIAIQGDWGSGKTSIMNMVKEELPGNILPIWFNTWEFSQFNMDENLALSFLTYLSDKLNQVSDKSAGEKLKKGIYKIAIGALKTLSATADLASGGGGSTANEFIKEIMNVDSIQAIDNLRETFQNTVDSVCKNGKTKITFFIDDLDRLQPTRAVELLEVLKIFLDCDKCVFALAIDYEVVSQGVKEKYNSMIDEKKGRKFFEKIIQVPFKVPVAHYDISGYIKQSLKSIGIPDEDNSKHYENLIRSSIGYNPRAMKRTFNAYLLLTKVHNSLENETSFRRLLLFGCLCMQLSYEAVYNYIITHLYADERDENSFVADEEFFQSVRDNGISEETCDIRLYNLIHEDNDYEDEQLADFLCEFCEILKDGSERVSQKAISQMQEIFHMTSITATKATVEGNNIEGRGARYAKEYAAEFRILSPAAVIKKQIKSFNGMKVEYYKIGDKRYSSEDIKFNMADFLKNALEHAYVEKPAEFELLRKEVLETHRGDELYKLHRLFEPKETDAQKKITEKNISISTYSSNDSKMEQICQVYGKLSLNVEDIEISMKEAVDITKK